MMSPLKVAILAASVFAGSAVILYLTVSVQFSRSELRSKQNGPSLIDASQPVGAAERVPQSEAVAESIKRCMQHLQEVDGAGRRALLVDLKNELFAKRQLGLAGICEFLSSGEDISFREPAAFDGDFATAPTFRTALIALLGEWPDRTVENVASTVLRRSGRSLEAILAVRALEKHLPGKYRAEAIERIKELSALPAANQDSGVGWDNSRILLELMNYYGAEELIELAEAAIPEKPQYNGLYAEALNALPEAPRRDAILRFLARSQHPGEIVEDRQGTEWCRKVERFLHYVDYRDLEVRSAIVETIRSFPFSPQWYSVVAGLARNTWALPETVVLVRPPADAGQARNEHVAQLQARLAFLEQLAVAVDQPEWKEKEFWPKIIAKGRENILLLLASQISPGQR